MKKRLFLSLICGCMLAILMCGGVLADAAAYDWESAGEVNYGVYVSTTDGGVNLRVEPTTDAEILVCVPDLVYLTITQETTSGWGFTGYNGEYGWVHLSQTSSSYPAKSVSKDVQVTAGDGVNLRTGPYQSYSKVLGSAIPKGTVLHVTETMNNWGHINYNGNDGWIALSQTGTYDASSSVEKNTDDKVNGSMQEPEKGTVDESADPGTSPSSVDEPKEKSNTLFIVMLIAILLIIAGAAVAIIVVVRK